MEETKESNHDDEATRIANTVLKQPKIDERKFRFL